MSSRTSPPISRSACLRAATADAKKYRAQTCKAQVMMQGREMTALGQEVEASTIAKGRSSSNSSSDSTAASIKGTNRTAGSGFPKSLPNSTYEEQIAFLTELLEQGQQGTLINGTTVCAPWTAYFDFTVQLLTYMLGNIGSGFGRIAGTSVGMAAGASIGQSGGMVGGAAASTVLEPVEEAALREDVGQGWKGRQRRGLEQRVEANPPQGQGRWQGSRRQRRRRRQQQGVQPLEDATIGLAGASGIGLGSGFAIGTSTGAAAGRQYGEKIGQEMALWIINNANFAIAYFGTLVLADVMNGVDLIVTDGITKVKIQKIIRSQIQNIEDEIFEDFTSVYNATVYADFSNLEIESAVFRSTVDAFGGMGVLFGFAAGMPVGAAVGASSGGIYGSAGAGTTSGAAQAAGARKRTTGRKRRKAQTSASSLAEELAAIDPLVALTTSMWMGTSIGVGSGTAIGMGAGISGGWQLSNKIGYAMGHLVVKFLVKAFTVFQKVYGQVVVDQIEQAIFDASAIRINITYTPTCDFSNYTYHVQDISYYVGKPPAGDLGTEKNKRDGETGAAAAAPVSGEQNKDLAAAFLQLLGYAATPATKTAPELYASGFYSRTAASFQSAVAATGTKRKQDRAAYDACQSYAISEMYRQKSLCYLS